MNKNLFNESLSINNNTLYDSLLHVLNCLMDFVSIGKHWRQSYKCLTSKLQFLLIKLTTNSYMPGIIYFYSACMFWSRIRFRIIQPPSSAKIVLKPLERFDIRSYCLRLIVLRIISKWVLVSRQVVCQWARCWDTLVRRLGARARRTVHFPQDNLPARILQTLTDSSANRFCIVSLTAPAVIYSPDLRL